MTDKVAVLGAGVMGSGIAAHLANAGFTVELLDLKPEWASGALDKTKKSRPASFMSDRFARQVRTGGFDENMDRIKDCIWVVEAVTEELSIKQTLFEKVVPHLNPNAWLTSNTSGIPLGKLTEKLPADVKSRFFITHFFNPARYMRLLEVVPGPDTNPQHIKDFAALAEKRLGKGVVMAKDTVNFIANRIGVHGMMVALHKSIELGYSVAEVDNITGPAMGRPSSATFNTADLVGLDTLAHVARNCLDNLPNDEDRAFFEVPAAVTALIAEKRLGRKSGAGFYKKEGADILSLDFTTLGYVKAAKPDFESVKKTKGQEDAAKKVATLLTGTDRAGAFVRATLLRSLVYAANRLGEIADDVRAIDDAMRWGFNWDLGPFELWQAIGVGKVIELMQAEGITVPAMAFEAAKNGGFYTEKTGAPGRPTAFERAKASGKILEKNISTRVLDLGDGVLGFDFSTKMNALDDSVVKGLNKALDLLDARRDSVGMVISNDASNFSVGANLMLIMMGIMQKNWTAVETMCKEFQDTFARLRKSNKPVIVAPYNMALGGGCELSLAGSAVRAHAELYMGLVEVGVGLIPGAGGTLELLRRRLEHVPLRNDIVFDRLPFIQDVFLSIGMAKVATSAFEARDSGFLRDTDGISFDRTTQVEDAKADVLRLAATGYVPPRDADFLILPGRNGAAVIEAALYSMELGGQLSAHDRLIGKKLARVLTGGDTDGRSPTSEQKVLDLEREAFLSLAGEEKTLARIQHMLNTGKPLRN
jgi:3-hydroxyacyl-CoA dehydrogenase